MEFADFSDGLVGGQLVLLADQDLLLSETLNSLSVTLLLVHLETVCNVQIPPEDVTLENFSTLEGAIDQNASRMSSIESDVVNGIFVEIIATDGF